MSYTSFCILSWDSRKYQKKTFSFIDFFLSYLWFITSQAYIDIWTDQIHSIYNNTVQRFSGFHNNVLIDWKSLLV